MEYFLIILLLLIFMYAFVCVLPSYVLEYMLQMLRENQNQGSSQLAQLRELCTVVSKSTAPKGTEILEKGVEDLESSFREHLSRVG